MAPGAVVLDEPAGVPTARFGLSAHRYRPGPSTVRVALLGVFQAFGVGWILHRMHEPDGPVAGHRGHALHSGQPEQLDPLVHYLRDATLAVPFVVAVLLVATAVARRTVRRTGVAPGGAVAGLIFAATAAVAASVGSAPGATVHAWVFGADLAGTSPVAHGLVVALVTLRHTFAIAVGFVLFVGVPWGVPGAVATTPHDRPSPAPKQNPGGRDVEPT